MTAAESLLAKIAVSIVTDGAGLPEKVKHPLREAQAQRVIGLSLESNYGPLVGICPGTSVTDGWDRNAIHSFTPSSKTNKRFGISIAADSWEAVSCFTVGGLPFYSRVQLHKPKGIHDSIREQVVTILDHFSLRCRNVLKDYLNELMRIWPEPGEEEIYWVEKNIIRKTAGFSKAIDCVALIDSDGFILESSGNADTVEEIAGKLGMFYHRTKRAIVETGAKRVECVSLSNAQAAVITGPVKNTGLILALSARGGNAPVIAPFVNDCAHRAFGKLARNFNGIWGTSVIGEQKPLQIRESWFSPPRLIAQGNYVGVAGRNTFHVPSCLTLTSTKVEHLQWFDKRSDAIRDSLTPCKSCNP
ncbi:MAG: hypothetical protein GF401_06610 [Chitinivibrionales bacterium]|nr:hypothetical protein [Chitinivibrionales bacterium]